MEKSFTTRNSLEDLENILKLESTSTDLDLDWSNITNTNVDVTSVDNAGDGLVMSLAKFGYVDINYISDITGIPTYEVIEKLKGSIYQDPEGFNGNVLTGWKTSDEYLSGNLYDKLNAAKKANKVYNGYFDSNVEALKSILPKGLATDEIYFSINSPWIPSEIIYDYIQYLSCTRFDVKNYIRHDEITGTWNIKLSWTRGDARYGTSRISGMKILQKILNMKSVCVYDYLKTVDNKTKKILNKGETVLAMEKEKLIRKEFVRWVKGSPATLEKVTRAYNAKYGYNVARHYDGSFLSFEGMSESIKLYKYQKDACARIVLNPNTLLAHDVGAGKTYIMIAAGMELKRMGLSKKNLYLVPNNITGQWKEMYLELYPNANVLEIEPKAFVPSKRRKTIEDIRDNEYDAIIMAYSCFENIPLSPAIEITNIRSKLQTVDELLKDYANCTTALVKEKQNLEDRYKELMNNSDLANDDITLDKLGITRLFIDEAHNFKNVPLRTKMNSILGLNPAGSSKCKEMMDKVRFIASTEASGIIMATGTPITNSVTDAYVFQSYLQPGELKLLDISNFDDWAAMFAEKHEEFEIDVDTSNYRLATRFSRFHNLPELTSLLANIADFHGSEVSDLPNFNGYTDIRIPKSKELADYLEIISKRADLVRHGAVPRDEDNMLKITTDGRKAALDLRLVNQPIGSAFNLKVFRCADVVYDLYLRYFEEKCAQLVFCDSSTPSDSFNMYDELKSLLINFGIPSEEIAFVHDATTDSKRNKLFESVRKGDIRVLIGSTFKLGTGVNVQDNLVAIHHLDVPWRPSDMVQREGRILRPGNTCPEVFIYRYISEGSFDAYSWQLLETKQTFINELLSNSLNERNKEDIANTVLDYAEVKALAVGNPLLKQRVEVQNEISRLKLLEKKETEARIRYKTELLEIPSKIENLQNSIANLKLDINVYDDMKRDYSPEERKRLRELVFSKVMDNILKDTEETVVTFQGFDILLPKNMIVTRPYIILESNGRYIVEMSNSEYGVLPRIENFLDGMRKSLEDKEFELLRLKRRKQSLKSEIDSFVSHRQEIEDLTETLETIDRRLK